MNNIYSKAFKIFGVLLVLFACSFWIFSEPKEKNITNLYLYGQLDKLENLLVSTRRVGKLTLNRTQI